MRTGAREEADRHRDCAPAPARRQTGTETAQCAVRTGAREEADRHRDCAPAPARRQNGRMWVGSPIEIPPAVQTAMQATPTNPGSRIGTRPPK